NAVDLKEHSAVPNPGGIHPAVGPESGIGPVRCGPNRLSSLLGVTSIKMRSSARNPLRQLKSISDHRLWDAALAIGVAKNALRGYGKGRCSRLPLREAACMEPEREK